MTTPPWASTGAAPSVLPPVLTRAEALACGWKRYFTGTPCPYGLIADRSLSDRGVVCLAEHSWADPVRRWAAGSAEERRDLVARVLP